jgi:predicted DNA-binding transcriptional regulator AlpA
VTTNTQKPTPKPDTIPAQIPQTGYIRMAALLRIIPFGKSTIWRKAKKGDFPKPVKLSDNITAWKAEDIRAWIENRETAQ